MFEPSGPTTRSQLRVFSACCIGLGFVLTWPQLRSIAWPPQHWSVWIGATFGLAGMIGLVRPASVRPVYAGAMVLTRPIGFVVAQVLLAILYFLVLTPLALVLRLTGHDPLRQRPPGAWRAAPTRRDLRSAFRQY